jgi:predicted phosphoribosyltransferase
MMFNLFTDHFADRKDASERLANILVDLKDKNALLLGIPRGGVEIAYYLSLPLHLDWTVVISKKLPYPGREEYGIGAVSEEGFSFVNKDRVTLSDDIIKGIIEERKKEVERRVQLYRSGQPLPDMNGKIVVIVDDGIATGATIIPVIRMCRKKMAGKIIVAAPVSGKDYDKELKEADEIRVLFQPDNYSGVGQAYRNFEQLSDEKVLEFIKRNKLINH